MNENPSFGAYIRKKRLEAGLTQKELARRLFVTESSVSKWERDLSYPDHLLVPAVCRELGITEHAFFAARDDVPAQDGAAARSDEPPRARVRRAVLAWGAARSARGLCLICYGAAAVCFLCNLSISRGLDWFWIVLASLALSFCFTNLPWLVEQNRAAACLGGASLSLLALLLACWCYAGGWWLLGGAAVTAVCLALPWGFWAVRRFSRGDIPARWALLFTVWVFALLAVIRFFSGGAWLLPLAYPIAAFCLGYLWLCLAAVRLVRGNPWLRAAALCLLTALAVPMGSLLAAWLAPGQKGFCWIDFFAWWHLYTHEGSPCAWINLLVFGVLLLCALAAAALGLTRAPHPREQSPE